MKTLLNFVRIIAVMAVIVYGFATYVTIHDNPKAFQDYRTEVCLKGLTLQDAYDTIKNGEANTHTKVNYGIKPYITFVYDTYIK